MRLLHCLTKIDFEMTKEEKRQAEEDAKKNQNNGKGTKSNVSVPLPNLKELQEKLEEEL